MRTTTPRIYIDRDKALRENQETIMAMRRPAQPCGRKIKSCDCGAASAARDMLAFLKKWSAFNIEGIESECDEYDAELERLIAKAEGRV